ncbi:hypothetical protein OHA02_50700 [Streptomyces phaeochromogenes]|nr:hypothetical protein [Streptomyces phaeochromogenes]
MTKVDEGGQESIDEDQLVFRPGTHGPATGTRRETSLVPLVPQRADLRDKFGDHTGLQPVIRWLRMITARARFPTTPTMINDHGPRRANANHARAHKDSPFHLGLLGG